MNIDDLNKNWVIFDKKTVPVDTNLLFKTERSNGAIEYHAGSFQVNGKDSVFGTIGGHFYFDYTRIISYIDISMLKDEENG